MRPGNDRKTQAMNEVETELLRRITLDPRRLSGKPTIRGLRITVEQLLRARAAGVSEAELLADYPELEPEDFRAIEAYAADRIAEERVFPVPAGKDAA
jgi:uncharacterized protein (DUF433 family)